MTTDGPQGQSMEEMRGDDEQREYFRRVREGPASGAEGLLAAILINFRSLVHILTGRAGYGYHWNRRAPTQEAYEARVRKVRCVMCGEPYYPSGQAHYCASRTER